MEEYLILMHSLILTEEYLILMHSLTLTEEYLILMHSLTLTEEYLISFQAGEKSSVSERAATHTGFRR